VSTPKKKGKRNSSFDAGSLYSGVGASFHGVGGNIGNTADNNARAKASKAPKPTFTPGPAPVKPPWAKSAKQNAADMGKPQGSVGDQIASLNPLFGAVVESGRSVTRLGKLASFVVQNDLSTNTKAKDPYEQAGGGESWGQMGLDLVNVLPVGKVVGAVGKKVIEAGEHLIAPTITVHARGAVNAVSKGFNTAEKWLEDLVHDAPDAATPRGAKINPTTVEPKTLAPTRTKPITKPAPKPITKPGEKPIKKPGEQPFTRPIPGPAKEPKPYHDPTKPRKPPKKPIPKRTPIPKETPVPAVPTPGPTIKPVIPPIPPKPETTPAPKKTPVPVVPPVVPTPAPTKSPVPKRTGEPIIPKPKPTKSPAPTPSVSPTPSRTATPKPTIKPEILPTPSPKTSRPSAPERSASPQPSVSPSASASATTPVIPPLLPLPGTEGTPEDPGSKLPPPPPEFPDDGSKKKPKPHLDLSVGQQQLYVPRIY